MTPRVFTNIVGFTNEEWRQIKAAAASLHAVGAPAGTMFLPGRPELYRLQRRKDGYDLRLTTEEEAWACMTGRCDCEGREG